MKTCRASAKRFKRSKSGKIIRRKAYASHLLTKKSKGRKRKLRRSTLLDASNRKGIERLGI